MPRDIYIYVVFIFPFSFVHSYFRQVVEFPTVFQVVYIYISMTSLYESIHIWTTIVLEGWHSHNDSRVPVPVSKSRKPLKHAILFSDIYSTSVKSYQ